MSSVTDKVREVFEGAMLAEFTALEPTVPIAFLNDKFEQPTNRSPWIQVAVVGGPGGRVQLGSPYPRWQWGVLNVTCMVPEGTGTKRVREIADAVVRVMADRQRTLAGVGSVTTYGIEQKDRGVINGWYVVNVMMDWRAYQTAA